MQKCFPDQGAIGAWPKYAVVALPLIYQAVALIYSANAAPWGRQVDPESAYAMNGLAWAAGYPMVMSEHPGTTTILLVGVVVRLGAFFAGRSDVIEFGLKNFDAIIYAARAAQAVILSGALLAGGIIVRNVTNSAVAAMLFQISPFANSETLHVEVMLIPESLMSACAIFGMALVLKAALDARPPTIRLGVAQGAIFALGLSSKILYAPLAVLGVCLLRSPIALAAAFLVGAVSFWLFNFVFHPNVFTSGFQWIVGLATHKGMYGYGEPGFIDAKRFWSNVNAIIAAAPIISAVFLVGGSASIARMVTGRNYFDPVSLTLAAAFVAFSAQVAATAKHFALHYMIASWLLTGGVLVLTAIEIHRLFSSRVSCRATSAAAALVCAALMSATLFQIRLEASQWTVLNNIGAKLSRAVVQAGPSCANVSGMFVRAPENELNLGADMTLETDEMVTRFSEGYVRTFDVPLLDHSFYRHSLLKNFHPYSYAQLAAEYPCLVVRTLSELDPITSSGLLELKPDHCSFEGIQIYTIGIPCEAIRARAATL